MVVQEKDAPGRNPARRFWPDIASLVSLLVFLAVTALLFRSWEFALVVTASLGFHELGHAAALAWYRLEWRISFGIVGAWTWSLASQRARLSHLQNAYIHLAGPVFSFALALLALILQSAWRPGDHHLLILANFSAQVGLLNLLPLGALTDGGKIIRRVAASLDSGPREWAALLPILLTGGMLAFYASYDLPFQVARNPFGFLLGLLLVGLWLASSLILEMMISARRPASPVASERMTAGQVYFLLLLVSDLLALGMLILAATPFWLSPEYVLGSLHNVLALLNLFLGIR